jgi:hypothetical protein
MNMIFLNLMVFMTVFHISLLTDCIMTVFNKRFCLLEVYFTRVDDFKSMPCAWRLVWVCGVRWLSVVAHAGLQLSF